MLTFCCYLKVSTSLFSESYSSVALVCHTGPREASLDDVVVEAATDTGDSLMESLPEACPSQDGALRSAKKQALRTGRCGRAARGGIVRST